MSLPPFEKLRAAVAEKVSPLAAALQTVRVRLLVAALAVVFHVGVFWSYGVPQFQEHFNTEPKASVTFSDPKTELVPHSWNRLIVSRWDSQHYIDIALRGFDYCPKVLTPENLGGSLYTCHIHFYPAYPLLGAVVAKVTHLPIDYALWAVSLGSSFVLLFLWTGPAVVAGLGLANTWLSFLLFNFFTTGFILVTLQTEPFLLMCTLGALVALARGRLLLGAFVAGAGSALRITGIALPLAYSVAVAASVWVDRPPHAREWLRRGAAVLLSGWGVVALALYFWIRLGDPLAYAHAHQSAYGHRPNILSFLNPPPAWLRHSFVESSHEGVWVFGTLLWFLLGHRKSLAKFSPPAQAYAYGLFAFSFLISTMGSLSRGLPGCTRYMLHLIPAFFAMAAVLARRPLALGAWLLASFWHYRHVDMCNYIGQWGKAAQLCGITE